MASSKSAGHKLKKLRELSASERFLLAESMICLPLTWAALRVLGFERVRSFLARLSRSESDKKLSDSTVREAQAVARLVKTAIRHGLVPATCLPESLVLWWLLRRRGLPVDLRIGTRKDNGKFEAHAWVELQGNILNDKDDVHRRFASFEQEILPGSLKTR